MKFKDITKDLSKMTDDELRQHIQHVRHTKYVAKPAKAKIISDAVKKDTRKKVSAIDKLLSGMSEEERKQLILQLGGGDD